MATAFAFTPNKVAAQMLITKLTSFWQVFGQLDRSGVTVVCAIFSLRFFLFFWGLKFNTYPSSKF
jgi:hypothetical protein